MFNVLNASTFSITLLLLSSKTMELTYLISTLHYETYISFLHFEVLNFFNIRDQNSSFSKYSYVYSFYEGQLNLSRTI